jgi:hypothetical protein
MTFLGDIEFDFDMSLITGALIGSYSLSDIFTSPSGIKMLGLLVTGTLGLSFPWSTIPQFSLAIGSAIYDLYKKKKNKMFTMKIKSNNRELIKLFSTEPTEKEIERDGMDNFYPDEPIGNSIKGWTKISGRNWIKSGAKDNRSKRDTEGITMNLSLPPNLKKWLKYAIYKDNTSKTLNILLFDAKSKNYY